MNNEEIYERARCKGEDTAIFFSAEFDDVRRAKGFCRHCTVKVDCLIMHLARGQSNQYGTGGGMTAKQRFALLRSRGQSGAREYAEVMRRGKKTA